MEDRHAESPIRLLTVFHTLEECRQQVLTIGRRLVELATAEPSCQRAQLLQDLDDPNRFVHIAEFASEAELQTFLPLEWRREIAGELLGFLDGEPMRYLLGPAGEPAAI